MGRSMFMINLGLSALFVMFTFQNSESQLCSSYYEVGSPAYFTYVNSSVFILEWRIQTVYNGNQSIVCNFTTFQCTSSSELSANVSSVSSVLIIHQIMTKYNALYVVVDGTESTFCRQLNIYANPESVTCFVSQAGFNQPTVNFNATKFFPKAWIATYYVSNGTDRALPGTSNCTNIIDQVTLTPNGSLPYYTCLGSWGYIVPSEYLRRGTNTFFVNMIYGGAKDPGKNSSKASIDIYAAISSFLANNSKNLQTPQGSVVILTCTVAPVPGENITLSRRNVQQFLNTTGGTTSITYVISAFQCSDIDEYVCTVDYGRWSNASTINVYSQTCPPQLTGEFQNNRTLTAKKGGSILLPFKVYSFSSVNATLWFIEDGVQYAAPNTLYTYYLKNTSTYNFDLNVALLNLGDSDFRNYFLQIRNSASGDGMRYYFTIAQENSVDVRGAAIGVGVIAIALLIVVVILALVICNGRRKRSGQQQAREMDVVKPMNYDSTGTSWGTDHKSGKTAASSKLASHPLKTTNSRGSEPNYEDRYEPISSNSKSHRPAIPLPSEEIYEIEPDNNSRPPSFYGNMTEQPIYGNI